MILCSQSSPKKPRSCRLPPANPTIAWSCAVCHLAVLEPSMRFLHLLGMHSLCAHCAHACMQRLRIFHYRGLHHSTALAASVVRLYGHAARTLAVALAQRVLVPVLGRRLHDKTVVHELLHAAPEGVCHTELLACAHASASQSLCMHVPLHGCLQSRGVHRGSECVCRALASAAMHKRKHALTRQMWAAPAARAAGVSLRMETAMCSALPDAPQASSFQALRHH